MRIAFAPALLLSMLAAPLAAAEKSPDQLLAEIERQGPAKVVHTLSSGSPEDWQHVLDSIGSGKDVWLKIAASLRPGTDAGTGEELSAAVAAALKANPDAVLRMIGPNFPLEEICTVPLIEPSPDQVTQWKSAAIAALAKADGGANLIRQCRDSLAEISPE